MPFLPKNLKSSPGRAARLRYLLSRSLIARRIVGRRLTMPQPSIPIARTLAVWPPVSDPAHLGDVENRIRWYLSHTDTTVLVPCSATLLNATVDTPRCQERCEASGLAVHRVADLRHSGVDAYLLVRGGLGGIARGMTKPTYMVDPSYVLLEEATEWFRLRHDLLPPARHTANRERSLKVYDDFLQRHSTCHVAYVLTTGPSLDRALNSITVDDTTLRVICNSAVKNDALVAQLRPQVVTFADCAFHFGPSRYAAEFRSAFVRFMNTTDAIAAVPEFCGDLLTSVLPQLADRIVSMPYQKGAEWNVPRTNAFFVRPQGTILTQLMIPIAAAVAPRILVAGADGRDPKDRFFWKHSSAVQFDDLMASVRETHPSFFDDNDYEAFYDSYCAEMESLIVNIESRGVQVNTITPSNIPALQARDRSEIDRTSL